MPTIHTLEIIAVKTETTQVLTVQCKKPTGFTYRAGQYFFLILQREGKTIRKPLSFSSAPQEPHLAFTKRLSTSPFSESLRKLNTGDTLTIEGPVGTFTLPEQPTEIVFIAGGIGITPFRSMLLDNATTKKHTITLLFGSTSAVEIVFQKELESFTVHHQIGGTITADFIREHIPDYSKKLFYICGSPAMVNALCAILQNELCIQNTHIKVERLAGY